MLAVLILPLVLAITVHEAAHGWTAYRLGDPTAFQLGRVSFNPLKHIDPVGTILVPLTLFLISNVAGGGFIFGWAKPVPVNARQLHHPRRDMALVALAGPGVNLIMALLWGLVVHLGWLSSAQMPQVAEVLIVMGAAGILINLLLMVLNLFPLLPLDGGRIFHALLPVPVARQFARLEPFGLIILLALLFTGVLGALLWPTVMTLAALIPGGAAVGQAFLG